MHFRAAASVALLACATHVAAEAKPYKIAAMPLPGSNLFRRGNDGYSPETIDCTKPGDTCAEACGDADVTACPSEDNLNHCFNPAKAQSCCYNGSGSSCDAGFYCVQDSASETKCCPNELDLEACAAALKVDGDLTTVATTSSTPTPTPTPTSTSTRKTKTRTTKTSTSTPVVTEVKDVTTSICPSPSVGTSSAWSGSNSTIATTMVPTQPAEPVPEPNPTTSSNPVQPTTPTAGASAKAASGLLLLAAGAVAFL